MRALVTGGAGFIGHHLVQALVRAGHDVVVLDDYSTGSPARLAGLSGSVQTVVGSILDSNAVDAAAAGAEVIFHLAAIASVPRSLVEPRLTNDINVGGTIEVVQAAARHGARRVVFASSSAVYGAPERQPCREAQRPDPTSPYGASKLAGEHYLHSIGAAVGVATVALRFFNVFGAGQNPRSEYAAVVPRFITAVLAGDVPVINGSGEISRDFVHVDNVVNALMLAGRDEVASGLSCNIASGEETTLVGLLEAIADAAGVHVEPAFGPPREGDVRSSRADIKLARRALGYRTWVPLETGVARTVAAFRASSDDRDARRQRGG